VKLSVTWPIFPQRKLLLKYCLCLHLVSRRFAEAPDEAESDWELLTRDSVDGG
jgi:hypothetical protein